MSTKYFYLYNMKQKDTRYSYPLKLDRKFKEPIRKIAKSNRRKINEEINIAVEIYIKQNQVVANGL